MNNFRELEFWKRSRVLAINLYSLTKSFPKEEQFGLTNQMRRASVSIPSNIAEGASRSSRKEFARFLEISVGSAHELETQLLIAKEIKLVDNEGYKTINKEIIEITKMVSSYKIGILRG